MNNDIYRPKPITDQLLNGYKLVAVLSTTVIPQDGLYRITRLLPKDLPPLKKIQHYIGHPATKGIVEEMGAIAAPTNIFKGLQPGECAVCFPISGHLSDRYRNGYTLPHRFVTIRDLSPKLLKRLE